MSARENNHAIRRPGETTRRPRARTALFVILASVLALAVAAVVVAVPIVRSRSIVFSVNGTPILQDYVSAMITDLPFDSTSNYYNTRIELANPSDPKTQYLVAGLKTEAIQRLVIMVAQADKAAAEGISVSPSALASAVETYIKDHVTPGDSAEEQRLRSPAMQLYIQLRETSKAYEDEFTKNVTISSAEVKEYYDTWGWNYKDKTGHELTIEQAGKKLVEDALANKKFHMILQDRAQLLKSEAPLFDGDTRYKQFMRWWDIMFGISVPDSLQPLTLDIGS